MTVIRTHTVTIDDVAYTAQFASIQSSYLGWEDHDVFTALISTTHGTFGGRQLDTVTDNRREPSEYGMRWISDVMTVIGVRNWEALAGKAVLLLSTGDQIAGIAHPTDDRVMLFDQHAAPEADTPRSA